MSPVLRIVLIAAALICPHELHAADDPPSPSPDEAAIQDAAVKFVDAYNAGDAAAITALFDPQARLEEADGTVIVGQEEIQQAFTTAFEAEPNGVIGLEIASLTLLTPDIAVEEGATEFYPDGETLTARGRYLVVHQKKDGTWRMISARSLEKDVLSNYEYLRDLEWLVGDWIDEDATETVHTTYRWDEGRNFLLQDFEVVRGTETLLKGTQRLGWDPQKKQIRGWIFDSEGGFADSGWVLSDDAWIVTITGVSSDGVNTTQTRTLVPGEDRVEVLLSNRMVGDESRPDLAFTMVRRPPAPASAAAETH